MAKPSGEPSSGVHAGPYFKIGLTLSAVSVVANTLD